jgi:hypothetical protein
MSFVIDSDSSFMQFQVTHATCSHIGLIIQWHFWCNETCTQMMLILLLQNKLVIST